MESPADCLAISRTSDRVIFWCGGSQYSVPIDGGLPVLLTPFSLDDITTSSDGSTVFGINGFDLISAPILGGGHAQLATLPAPFQFLGDPVVDLVVAPGDQFAFMRLGVSTGTGNYELWGAPAAGGGAQRYSEASRRVDEFTFSEDGSRIFYVQGLIEFEFSPVRSELLSQPIGGGEVFSYTPDMPLGGEVHDYEVQGSSVHYTADFDQEDVRDLYLAIEVEVFADGFESGDLSAWSAFIP